MGLAFDGWNYVSTVDNTPPDQYGVMDYSEKIGSGDISTSPGNPGVTRTFYCLHSVIPSFLDSLLGYAITPGAGGTGTLSRFLPDPHPVYSNMFANSASVRGVGPIGQYNLKYAKYPVAEITANYTSPSYEIKYDADTSNELDRFITRQYSFTGESMTIQSTGLKYVSNPPTEPDGTKHKATSQPPTRPIMAMEMTYTWHWVPANPATSPYIPPNLSNIKKCYGKVNTTAFDTNHMNCPAGTVVFLGVDPQMTNYRIVTGSLTDNIYWQITFKFLYRDNGFITRSSSTTAISEQAGHQFTWDAELFQWDLLTTTGLNTGKRLWEKEELNDLFKIG